MTRRILVIHPDGSERDLGAASPKSHGKLPPLETMKEIVGGWIEIVRVLRADLTDRNEYTLMVVNDEGLPLDLPHNERATEIYLANVARAFPDHPEPWVAADETWRGTLPTGTPVFDTTPSEHRGKKPSIRGTVIWFDGYTRDELLEMGI